MALNITSKEYGPEKLLELQVLSFLLQYALENDVSFVDEEELDDWILGATDAQADYVFTMGEEDKYSLLADLNVLLSVAFEESEKITFSSDFGSGE